MDNQKIVFWNVDTQKDFIEPGGKLYVPGAELLKGNLKLITKLASKNSIRVINTADYHFSNSPELDKNPDMINTFPEHCMAGSDGADFIEETNPENPAIFNWNENYLLTEELDSCRHRNIILRKDAFDVFKGSPHTKEILEILSPKIVFIYGVTTNICVDYAVVELAKKIKEVYVIKDAIKELPGIPLPFEKWEKLNVTLIELRDLAKIING